MTMLYPHRFSTPCTLRRLLSGAPAPLVLEAATAIATVARSIGQSDATAVLVDAALVVRGTLRATDIATPSAHSAELIAVKTPMLEPETDLETACSTMLRAGVDRVLVVTVRGQLLGVITRGDVERAVIRA